MLVLRSLIVWYHKTKQIKDNKTTWNYFQLLCNSNEVMNFIDTSKPTNRGAESTNKVGRASCWVLWECVWVGVPHGCLPGPHAPSNPWRTTQGDEPLKVDTVLLHCLPWWAPKTEIRKVEGRGRSRLLLTRQQATTNYDSGQRANVPVRKWKRAIQWSCTVSTLNPQLCILCYLIAAVIIKATLRFPVMIECVVKPDQRLRVEEAESEWIGFEGATGHSPAGVDTLQFPTRM